MKRELRGASGHFFWFPVTRVHSTYSGRKRLLPSSRGSRRGLVNPSYHLHLPFTRWIPTSAGRSIFYPWIRSPSWVLRCRVGRTLCSIICSQPGGG